MRAILQGVIIVIIIGLVSCKKDRSAEETFFMHAEQVKVAPSSKQGSASHKITDLWLYVNGQFQGAYPTDALLPIVSKGKPVTINIFAGIITPNVLDLLAGGCFNLINKQAQHISFIVLEE